MNRELLVDPKSFGPKTQGATQRGGVEQLGDDPCSFRRDPSDLLACLLRLGLLFITCSL